MEKPSETRQRNVHLCRYEYVISQLILIFFSTIFFVEAKYVGTWNSGKRQGPGELQFNQYRYVGKFQENYVRIE